MKTSFGISVSWYVGCALFAALVLTAIPSHVQAGTAGQCGGSALSYTYRRGHATCDDVITQCSSSERVTEYSQLIDCGPDEGQNVRVFQQCTPDPECLDPSPTVTLTATPNPIYRGDYTALQWSSTNATTCTSNDFSVLGNATSGSVNVAPQSTQAYAITCTGATGKSRNASIQVTVNPAPFRAQCSPSPTTVNVGQTVSWHADAFNGIAPYFFSWVGSKVDGKNGQDISVTYDTPGTKDASVKATDSATSGAGYATSYGDQQRCTGASIGGNYVSGHAEDLGTQDENINVLKNQDMYGVATGDNPWVTLQGDPQTPQDVINNPQNYCIEGRLWQRCNPNNYSEGPGACTFEYQVTIHSGPGTRAAQSSDFGSSFYDQGPNGSSYWTPIRYFGTLTGSISPGVPHTDTQRCTATVNVLANAPAATLSANPVGITAGGTSTLTWTCSNSTSASIDNGVGPVSPVSGGNKVVSPAATTTYKLTCTGQGGTATATAQVTVTPALSATCSVTPASVPAGTAATWTATPTGGTNVYTYTWSGGDGLTGSTQSVQHIYSTPGGPFAGSVKVDSGNQSVTVNCSNSVTVTGTPNLQAGAVSPTSAIAGSSVTFSAQVSNVGNASTGRTFTDLLQRASDAQGSNAADIGTFTNPVMAETAPHAGRFAWLLGKVAHAASSNNATFNYTFPGGDGGSTVYVRACADKASAGDPGVIDEGSSANENDNCGTWTAVSVATPVINSCTASATTINPGDTVTFTANPGPGVQTPYTWNGVGLDPWSANTGVPSIQHTYTNTNGGLNQVTVKGANTASVVCQTVTVTATTCPGPANLTVSATPSRVKAGGTSTITWGGNNVGGPNPTCTLTGPGINKTVLAAPPAQQCALTTTPEPTGAITKQTTYSVTCSDGSSKSTTVNIIPKFQEF